MDNPELVEEFPREFKTTQFEKIVVAAKRAKHLHNEDRAPMVLSDRKAGYVALQELKEDKIRVVYPESETVEKIGEEREETEDE